MKRPPIVPLIYLPTKSHILLYYHMRNNQFVIRIRLNAGLCAQFPLHAIDSHLHFTSFLDILFRSLLLPLLFSVAFPRVRLPEFLVNTASLHIFDLMIMRNIIKCKICIESRSRVAFKLIE